MKKLHKAFLLSLMATSLFALSACSDDDNDDSTVSENDNSTSSPVSTSGNSDDSGSTTTDSSSSSSSQSAYLPDEFKSKTVSALYTYTSTETNKITNTVKTSVLAWYFFSDGNFVTTYRTSADGCSAKGTYTHTGDFTNDTISTSRTHKWNDNTSTWIASADTDTITVTNGSF